MCSFDAVIPAITSSYQINSFRYGPWNRGLRCGSDQAPEEELSCLLLPMQELSLVPRRKVATQANGDPIHLALLPLPLLQAYFFMLRFFLASSAFCAFMRCKYSLFTSLVQVVLPLRSRDNTMVSRSGVPPANSFARTCCAYPATQIHSFATTLITTKT